MKLFASDNSAPACPEVLEALERVNTGHVFSYGTDMVTSQAHEDLSRLFAIAPEEMIVALVPNGTGANVIGLSTFLRQWDGVIAGPESHITEDECGALEGLRGIKIYHVPDQMGKIHPSDILPFTGWDQNIHRNNPRAVSLTQATELGTVYSPEEIAELGKVAAANSMILHLDGARLANAVVAWCLLSENAQPAASEPDRDSAFRVLREMTIDAGVGVLALGATKNGGLSCDGLIIFPRNLPAWALMGDQAPWNTLRLRVQRSQKQALGLLSKYRYASAQISALFSSDVWIRNAAHANNCAQRLAQGIQALASEVGDDLLSLVYPVQANGLWVRLPGEWVKELQESFGFYVWTPENPQKKGLPIIRLMTSWDTSEESVDALVHTLGSIARKG